jgi:transposase-like protein
MSLKNSNMNGIAAELKSKILAESRLEGAVISLVAKKYNISKGTIYHWMKSGGEKPNTDQRFVELEIVDQGPNIDIQIETPAYLKSAVLAWNDLSIEIEGKILSSHLLEIIKIVSNKSC